MGSLESLLREHHSRLRDDGTWNCEASTRHGLREEDVLPPI
jgi:hypothetical protein